MIDNMTQLSEHEFRIDFPNATKGNASASSESTVNGNNKFVIAVDMDDVLVNTSNKWFAKIRQCHILSDYMTSAHHAILNIEANLRSEYYLDDWLGITLPEHRQRLRDLYFQDPTFYDDLEPLPYMVALHKCQDIFSHIHIITKCSETVTSPADISKKRWLAKYFAEFSKDVQISFHLVPLSTNKGEYLAANNIHPNTFVDDQASNHVEFMKHTSAQNPELVMPLYGFNAMLPADLAKAEITKPYRLEFFHNMTTMTQQEMTDYFRPKDVV